MFVELPEDGTVIGQGGEFPKNGLFLNVVPVVNMYKKNLSVCLNQ